PPPKIAAALSARLHGGFTPDGSWDGGEISFHLDPKSGRLDASVGPEIWSTKRPNPIWKRQIVAAYHLLLNVLYDRPVPSTSADIVASFAGYPIGKMASLD